MLAASRYIILLLLLMYAPVIRSQNITGSWEGLMKDEFLQLNIVQEKDDALCGYTFDHLLTDKKSYCIAYFTGHYNKYQKSGDISGVAFLKNSGTHLLMSIRFFEDKIRGEKVLVAMVSSKSTLDFFLSFGVRETVILTRVGNVPARLPDNLPVCFPEPESRKEKPLPKTNPAKPIMPDTLVKKPEVIIPPADTISVVRIPKKDSLVFDKELLARKNTTFSRIPVTSKYIELHVYDNAIIDDDTVSIFYNSKKLISKQRLSGAPIIIKLELDEQAARHELILVAENLGSIPPNTALIIVMAGNKRYELYSSASLRENAVLVFDYSPK